MSKRSLSGINPPRKKISSLPVREDEGRYPELIPWSRSKSGTAVSIEGSLAKGSTKKSTGGSIINKTDAINKEGRSNSNSRARFFKRAGRRKKAAPKNAPALSKTAKRTRSFVLVSVALATLVGLFAVFQWGLAAKDKLTDRSWQGAQALVDGSAALVQQNLVVAQDNFRNAGLIFSDLEGELRGLSRLVKTISVIVPGDPYKSATRLSEAGTHFANAGVGLTQTLKILSTANGQELSLAEIKINQPAGPTSISAPSRPPTGGATFVAALKKAQASFDMVVGEIARAKELVDLVDVKRLPANVADKVSPLIGQIPAVVQDLHKINGLLGVVARIIGADQAHYYAVVLQNSRELRPTGGFMGQFAILKVQGGQVEDVKIKSIYDADGQVNSKISAPAGLNVISKSWSLRDANWSADFPSSAKDILSFFKRTGDPPLDGVIAMTPKIIEDLLSITGPIDLPDLNLKITADNFVEQAQNEVPDKNSERDKLFFSKFSQKLLMRLFNPKELKWQQYLTVLVKAANHKDLQIYLTDEQAQQLVKTIGVDGGMPPANDQDILFVSEANIGGGKTDVFINEQRSLNLVIGPKTIKHELTIVRHDSRTNQFLHQKNRQFVRFYLPPNANFISAVGFDQDDKDLLAYKCSDCEAGAALSDEQQVDRDPSSGTQIYKAKNYKVLANWTSSLPGDTKTVRIVYETPLTQVQKVSQRLILTLGRQAGTKDIVIDVRARKGSGERLKYVSGLSLNEAGIGTGEITLDEDRIIGILF